MMNVKETALQAINSYPEYAKEALENVYRGKVFIVFQPYRNTIEKIAKTKRGAEGYIKKQQAFTYYDEYTNELVTCGSGLTVLEIDPTQIENPQTSKTLWYRFMKEYHGQTWYYDNIVKMAKQMNVSVDVMEYILQSVEDMKNNRGLTVLEEAEQPTTQQEMSQPKEAQHEQQQADVKATYTLNEQLNGIEITFTDIPSEEIRNELKAQGFRWSKYKKVWYAKQSEERLQFAKMLVGETEQQTEEVAEQSEAQQEPMQVKEVEQKTINNDNSTQEKEQGQKTFTVIPEVQENTFDLQFFSGSINTDDILNLFDTINLTQEKTLISDEDREHINKYEDSYKTTLSVFENTLQQLQEIHKQYGDYYSAGKAFGFVCDMKDIREMEERTKELKENFIYRICRYFMNKYNVTIDYKTIYNKYDTTVTAQNILDEIVEQLDGFTFAEKAQQEIKQQLKEITKNTEVKDNKLILSNFFYIDSFDLKWGSYKLSYNSYGRAQTLLKALYLYEYNITQLTEEAEQLLKTLKYSKNDDVFTTHELNLNKIKSIKLYKNGRVDIEFTSSHYAREFAKDFLNIVKAA
ncbi:hypothetical protein HPK02_05395 [Anoxybacillus flavithermus]|uniref:hypothetical protein n=1 Tax=Anoxybacillus flavithermus TaxID=33934 RepID=UPI001866F376|nr:hypothetical protein [Anoxybacillus flavithermus]MBE2918337.1 hypothetical protein [Anoxybacillus flavithermus]